MDDFVAYKLFHGIKKHFESKTYNVIEAKGAVSGINEYRYDKAKDKPYFQSLAKKFKSPKDFIEYCVACAAYDKISCIYNTEKSSEIHKEWVKNRDRCTQIIVDDIDSLNLDEELSMFPPKILTKLLQGKIHIETAVAINKLRPFVGDALLKKEYLFLNDIALKIRKLEPFVKFNESVVQDALNNNAVGGGG